LDHAGCGYGRDQTTGNERDCKPKGRWLLRVDDQSVMKIINKKPISAPKAKANVAPEKTNAYFLPLGVRTQIVKASSAIVMKGAA
jgi:hypothetical protein